MTRILRSALLVILAVTLAACSTYSVVANTHSLVAIAVDSSSGVLQPGDNLELQLLSGEKIFLTLESIEPDALVGTPKSQGKSVRVPTNQIEIIKREEKRKEIDAETRLSIVAALMTLLIMTPLMLESDLKSW
ncbi:MAG: hypothetical protein OEZ09_12925 [Betaproteobacteria bacterium]|nr:hypothetical protein [Betaproteobacteria bacterium]MDH5579348.1 hypothetical protein [Betaproteobacteria bacterium]